MGGGRDLEDRVAEPLGDIGAHQVGEVTGVRHVDLVERDDPRPAGQPARDGVVVRRQLGLDLHQVTDRIATALGSREVDDVHDDRAALDVAQELQAEPAPAARAGDQPGHVGDGEHGVAGLDHAEVGHQRRERVVGDLRSGRGHRGDQRGLAGVGIADEGDVGDALELEHGLERLAGLAEQREAGRLAPRRGERGVAETTAAAAGGDEAGADADQVGDQLTRLGVAYHCAVGHPDHQVAALGAGAVGALAGLAAGGALVRMAMQVEQRGHTRVDEQHDIAAPAAVTAVRAAERLELLAMHRRAAMAAVAGGGVQERVVYKGRGHAAGFRPSCRPSPQRRPW